MALPTNAESTDTTGTPSKAPKKPSEDTRAITSISQALSVCEQLITDSDQLVRRAAKITAKLNGERPRSGRADANKGKSHKSNVLTGALSTTCSKIPPRFYMPIKTARYLVAGTLDASVDGSVHKSEFFRENVTKTIRRWKKFNFYVQALANEVGIYGYGFPSFFNEYEWRPRMIRQDKGFVPIGTELLDTDTPFYCVKWEYRPDELLRLLEKAEAKGKKTWQVENVRTAVKAALPKSKDSGEASSRESEDLVRQASLGASYSKGAKKIETFHLFAKESSGKISHYILLSKSSNTDNASKGEDSRLLYQKLDRFEAMDEVMAAVVFQFGNGTVHGSLGAGQILYDMSVQVELTRNESFDNLKLSNKLKLQVSDGKDINTVKAMVMDEKVIVSGASFAGSTAAMPVNVEGFIALDRQMTGLMEEKVGAFLPPAIVPGASPTATQISVQAAREDEIRSFILDNWLTQFAQSMHMMVRRLCNPASPDKDAQALIKLLRTKLSTEEIEELVESSGMMNIMEFTEVISQRRAQFAASVRGNPMYDQAEVERVIAESAVGSELASVLLPKGQDQTLVAEAQRQQFMENAVLLDGQVVPVVPRDNDYIHMEAMKNFITAMIKSRNVKTAQAAYEHYKAHYDQWIAKKAEPKNKKNDEKKLMRSWELAIQELGEQEQRQQELVGMEGGQPPTEVPPEELAV